MGGLNWELSSKIPVHELGERVKRETIQTKITEIDKTKRDDPHC